MRVEGLPSRWTLRSWIEQAGILSIDDVERYVRALTAAATIPQPVLDKNGNVVGERLDIAAAKEWRTLVLGNSKTGILSEWKGSVESIDLSQLATLDGCRAMIADVMRARATGVIGEEQAEEYRASIRMAMTTHQMQAGERVAEALEGLGGEVWYGDAGQSPEEKVKAFAAHIKRITPETADGE